MKRAWIVILGCVLGLSVSISGSFYSTLPVFEKSMAAGTGWSRTQIVTGLTICTFLGLISSPVIGRLVDRYGPRLIIALTSVPFGASLMSIKLVGANYHAYLLIAIFIGLFGNCCNTFVYLSFLPQWFDRRLGLSLSLSATGIGVGQATAPIVAFSLLRHAGWRNGFVVLGMITIAVTLFSVVLFLRNNPLHVFTPSMNRSHEQKVPGLTRAEAMRTAVFWRLAGSIFLITLAVAGSVVSLVPLLTDRGVPTSMAVRLAAITGLSVLLGRLVGGFLMDEIAASKVARVVFLAPAFGICILWLGLSHESYYLAVPLIGLALGAEGDIMAYMVRRAFGPCAYGEIYSYLWSSFMAGLLVGPVLMSASYGVWGTYSPALVFLGVCAVLSAIAIPGTKITSFSSPQALDGKLTGVQSA